MNSCNHPSRNVVLVLLIAALLGSANAYAQKPQPTLVPPPTKQDIIQIQSDFLQLELPIRYSVKTTTRRVGEGIILAPEPYYHRELQGEARVLQESYPPAWIAWALTPYLDDPQHDAEAYLIVDAAIDVFEGNQWSYGKPTTYVSRGNPGDWPVRRKELASAGAAENAKLNGIKQSQVRDWDELESFHHYRIPPGKVLPSSIKKKSRLGSWLSRLFRR